MQATKVKEGQEYATVHGDRIRITGPGKKEIRNYGTSNTIFPCVFLDVRTGEEIQNWKRSVVARVLAGLWTEYEVELKAREDARQEQERQRKQWRRELVAIMEAHGFEPHEYRVTIHLSRELCHAEVHLPKEVMD